MAEHHQHAGEKQASLRQRRCFVVHSCEVHCGLVQVARGLRDLRKDRARHRALCQLCANFGDRGTHLVRLLGHPSLHLDDGVLRRDRASLQCTLELVAPPARQRPIGRRRARGEIVFAHRVLHLHLSVAAVRSLSVCRLRGVARHRSTEPSSLTSSGRGPARGSEAAQQLDRSRHARLGRGCAQEWR